MEPKRDADVERLLTAIDGVTDHEKHYEYRSTVLRLDSENRRLNELCAMYEVDLKRLRNAMQTIAACAGAPDPVDALRNVVWVAADAIGEWDGTFSLHAAKAEGRASRLAKKIDDGEKRRERKRQKRAMKREGWE